MDEFLQSSPPASGDKQPVPHGGMVRRHGQDRGGEDCGYAASLGQRKRVAHIPTADPNAAEASRLNRTTRQARSHLNFGNPWSQVWGPLHCSLNANEDSRRTLQSAVREPAIF